MTAQERGCQRTSGTGGNDDERCARRRTVGARQRREASVATHALDVATIDDTSTCLESTLEQCLLQTTDRNQRERRLRGECRQIMRALGNATKDPYLTGNRAASDEVTLATRREQRHDLRIANVYAEMVEIREVTLASHEQLRTQPWVELWWWAAVYDENCKLQACKLDRQRQTHRACTNDRYIKLRRGKRGLRHDTRPSAAAAVVEVVVEVGMYKVLLSRPPLSKSRPFPSEIEPRAADTLGFSYDSVNHEFASPR